MYETRTLALLTATILAGVAFTANAEEPLRYNQHVRPILSNACFACHGPDGAARKADLRLDIREDAIAERGGVRAIVPGNVEASELIKRINHHDVDERMPPAELPRQLTERDKEVLAKWIEQGAEYEAHWSYIPPSRPKLPTVSNADWARNPIDRFVLRRLQAEGIAPSPEADRVTLIRRAHFDLTGLPPTRDEALSALNDDDDRWYDRMVDRLLDSPHFGERMAVSWLDAVRYADSNGYHSDEERSMWPYRDYVINAFNDNKPFDDFTIEQLAGDLLPNARTEQQVASGFNRLNPITAEGGAQAKEYLAMYAADRVRATSTVWMGSTMLCAECHDHKYDPFSMRDFYSMEAFFADIEEVGVYPGRSRWEPVLELPTLDEQVEEKQLRAELAAFNERLKMTDEELAPGRLAWEAAQWVGIGFKPDPGWLPVRPSAIASEGGATLTVSEDATVLSSGTNPDKDTYELQLRTNRSNITGLRLEVLPDVSFNKGLARESDVVALMELEVRAGDPESQPLPFESAESTATMEDYPPSRAIDGDINTGWAVMSAKKEDAVPVLAVFAFDEPVPGGANTTLHITMRHTATTVPKASFGKFRISLTTATPELEASDSPPEHVLDAVFQRSTDRSPEATESLYTYYRHISPELAEVRANISATESALAAHIANYAITLVTKSKEPRPIRILPRGDWMDDSGEIVEPAVPSFLPQPETSDRRLTRLDLADWLISDENPLTARVYVNRLWQRFYGNGLSGVLNDLGAQGEWPTHPELLDWLAVEFMESGWDIKHMVRLMVTSSAYRQASDTRQELVDRDPYNRLLARQSRGRRKAEFVRDNALAVSGLLVRDIGGRSVRPYQPEGYWAHMNFPKRTYEADTGDHLYRRALYTHWQRSFLHPSMLAFDAPNREECIAERVVSNTPQQALTLLNDPIFVEAARAFAERIIREGGPNAHDRITWALRETLTREPEGREVQVLFELVAEHLEYFTANPEEAKRVLTTGEKPAPSDLAATELAAWTSVARVILNLHETIART